MTNQTISAAFVTAIEAAWSSIQKHNTDVPEVIVTIGGGSGTGGLKLGHFAADRWVNGEQNIHELFVGGEGLQRGGRGVMGTLLHEAAHGAARERGVKDTSRQGRYHNKRFQSIGEEFGLTLEHDSKIGWSVTSVPDATATKYKLDIARLDKVLVAYRLADISGLQGGRTSNNNGASAICSCGRKIRVSNTVFELGEIVCGVCSTPFQKESDQES